MIVEIEGVEVEFIKELKPKKDKGNPIGIIHLDDDAIEEIMNEE